jgi:hypothetical protein
VSNNVPRKSRIGHYEKTVAVVKLQGADLGDVWAAFADLMEQIAEV